MKEVVLNETKENLLVALSGDIDSAIADEFYSTIVSAFENAPKDVIFTCADLQFIDSTVLGAFVKILKHVRAQNKKMKLTALQPKIKKLFTICALDKIMEIE